MKKLLISVIFFGFSFLAIAQTQDVQLWTGPVIKYNISKKFRLDLEQQFRFNENVSKYNFTFTELSLRYRVFKYLDVKALYRHTFIPATDDLTTGSENDQSRASLDASTGVEIFNTGIEAGYRVMYQNSWDNSTQVNKNYFRNRFDLGYNLSKLVDPYASWESFFRFDGKNQWRQHRYTFGLDWKITKKLDIDSYFHFEKEINVKHPETLYIWGLALEYTIN
jgi:hypothetical protein